MDKLTVSADALRQVLQALNGPGHYIRELQVTRGPLFDNPIDTLIAEYKAGMPKPPTASAIPVDTPLSYHGLKGQVHHAFHSEIAPSGLLVGVYRYGPRGNYIGLVDSSQVQIEGAL